MRKKNLPNELEEKYLELKSMRDFCLKHGVFIPAFYRQVQITEFYNSLSKKYQSEEDISDNYQIIKTLVEDCFDNEDKFLVDLLYCNVAIGLGHNLTLHDFPNEDYLIKNFCVHIHIIRYFYWIQCPKCEIEKYIDNLLFAYQDKYGSSSDEYLKLCLHLLFEGIAVAEDFEYAQSLFIQHLDRFVKYLNYYDFTYEVLLGFANAYLEISDYDNTNKIIKMSEKLSQKLANFESRERCRLRYALLKARMLHLQGLYSQSEEYCTYILESIKFSDPIFSELCCIMMANYMYSGKDFFEWVKQGIDSCEFHNDTNSLTHYRLLSGLAYSEYLKGDTSNAIRYGKEVLDGIEKLHGKESNAYILAVLDYIRVLDNDKIKQSFLDDIIDTIAETAFPPIKAHFYNILSTLGYNDLGKPIMNTFEEEAERMARNAILESDTSEIGSLKIASRINLLNQLIRQIDKYAKLEHEIEQLFDFLEKNRNKMNDELLCAFNMCYIVYYCNHNEPFRSLEIAENTKNNILPHINNHETLMRFDVMYIDVLLINEMKSEVIAFLNSQMNEIAKKLHNFNDLTMLSEYLSYIVSVISQYGKAIGYGNDLFYKCALMLKYINTKLYPDFERSGANFDISRQMSALELRQVNIETYDKDNATYDMLRNMRSRLDYSSDKSFCLPQLNDICLPESSVLLDIYAFAEVKHKNFSSFEDIEDIVLGTKLAIFATYKDSCGEQQTVRLSDIDWEKILEIDDLLDVQKSLKDFYYLFISKAEKYFVGSDTLYLSLDYALPMLPFGAFLDQKNVSLFEKYNIINVLTPTDIKSDFYVDLKDALLIGNPHYNIDEKYNGKVNSLPYTEIEINLIEEMLGSSKKFLRKEARKDAFFENLDSNIIHISSHGKLDDFNPERLSTPLIGSSILLSGWVDFAHSDKSDGYGNGILTAEDIINLNLDETNLVVFSSCESGLGYFDDSHSVPKGLRWALGFTGAKASISSVFEVDDVLTAILMVFFYRNLMHMPLAKSLNEAKKQLRNLSVKDIKSDEKLYFAIKTEAEKQLQEFSDIEIEAIELFYHSLNRMNQDKALNKAKKLLKKKYRYEKDGEIVEEFESCIKSGKFDFMYLFASEFKNWADEEQPFIHDLDYWNLFECYFYGGVL